MVDSNHHNMGIRVVWGAHSQRRVFAESDDIGSRDGRKANLGKGVPCGVYGRRGERTVYVAVI